MNRCVRDIHSAVVTNETTLPMTQLANTLSEVVELSATASPMTAPSLTIEKTALRPSCSPPPQVLRRAESKTRPTTWVATPTTNRVVAPHSLPIPGRPEERGGQQERRDQRQDGAGAAADTGGRDDGLAAPFGALGQLRDQQGAEPEHGDGGQQVHRRDRRRGLTDDRGVVQPGRGGPVDEAEAGREERRGDQGQGVADQERERRALRWFRHLIRHPRRIKNA